MTCARCGSPKPAHGEVLGKGLCGPCYRAFEAEFSGWLKLGDSLIPTAGKAKYGERWQHVLRVLSVHGYVTSTLLAEHIGQHRTPCNWYLHRQAKLGRLTFQGQGWFVLSGGAK